MICYLWWAFNWLLSLASVFAVRDGQDAGGAIAAAVDFCREHFRAVFAVSTWAGLAHLAALVGASTMVAMPLGLASILPWRLIVAGIIIAFAQNGLLDRRHTPTSYREGLRKTLNFIMDSIRV